MRLCLGRPLALSVVVSAGFGIAASAQQAIDRRALVDRHVPVLRGFDTGSPLSVGNGEFAFTVDATGLQTFAEAYDEGVPLGTLSQWAWHTDPNPNGYSIDRFRLTPFESHGRQIPYADVPGDQRTPEVEWLRRNPHRLHLGRIGFRLRLKDGREATAEDVKDVEQRLELWDGTLLTRFRLDGEEVMVETLCHPTRDAIGVRVVSPLVGRGQIGIRLRFPYGSSEKTAADWTRPQAHETKLVRSTSRNALFERGLDHDRYRVSLAWSVEGRLKRSAEHDYLLTPETKGDTLDLLVGFSPGVPARMLPPYEEVRRLARESWNKFWSLGGAVDLSGSRDPRWRELERRIVLSQYLTAIQCAGRYPPQETGLTFNSWYGKFHLEMHWWHAAQFALWGRHELLERSLGYYEGILSRAQATAASQGYAGARWPKMTDLSGRESPSTIGPFLVWQQPHPIYLAELVYREQRDRTTLERYRGIVDETAEFMASYAFWDEAAPALRARSAAAGRAGDLPEGEHEEHAVRARLLALRPRDRAALARSARRAARAALAGGDRSAVAAADARRPLPLRRDGARELQRPALRARPPVGGRRPRLPARVGRRSRDDAPHARLDLGATGAGPTPGAGTTRCSRCAPRDSGSPSARSTRS